MVANGRIYLVIRQSGTCVLRTEVEFELLTHNVIESDSGIWNATPVVHGDRLYLSSGNALYYVGRR